MAEFAYQDTEAWNTAVRLAASVGRLRVGSNLKAAADAQAAAFAAAGEAAGLIAEGSSLEGGPAVGAYRDARAALARARSWLSVLAVVTNERESVFGDEMDMAELAARQVSAILRTIDRGGSTSGRPATRPGPTQTRQGPPAGQGGGRPPGPRGFR